MELKSNLGNIKVRVKKSNKQENKMKNIVNLYNALDKVNNFYKDYSAMIFNTGYESINRK